MEKHLPTDTDFDKTFKVPLKNTDVRQPLTFKRKSVSKSQIQDFAKTGRLTAPQLTRRRLDLTNDNDDAQNLYGNKSLILIVHDENKNTKIIHFETICALSIISETPKISQTLSLEHKHRV